MEQMISATARLRCQRPDRAFTLIELLVVMGVIVVLLAIALPSFTSVAQGTDLTRAGDDVANTIITGRNEALTRNRKVNIRLIELTGADGKSFYRALQAWVVKSDDGTEQPLTKVIRLPESVVIAESVQLSPIIDKSSTGSSMMVEGKSVPYRAFSILATGTLQDSIPDTASYLTVVRLQNAGATNAPPNFLSVYISPATGEVRTFRP